MAINRSFADQVRAVCEKAKQDMAQVVVETIQDINEEIVRATPVKFGNLRGHWTASLGAPAAGTSGQADRQGAGTVAKLNAVVAGLEMGQTYYAVNGAPYAARLEYGFVGADSLGRTYNQPPRAFVRTTMARAGQIAEEALARIRGNGA